MLSNAYYWPNKVTDNFRRHLLNQFIHSPLCSSISLYEGDNSEWLDGISSSKIESKPDERSLPDKKAKAFYVQSGKFQMPIDKSEPIDSIGVIVSKYAKFPSAEERRSIEKLISIHPDCRISIFKIGRILPSQDLSNNKPFLRSRKDLLADGAYSIMSQFLPVRFREIHANHLALAVRLNYETCQGMSRKGLCICIFSGFWV